MMLSPGYGGFFNAQDVSHQFKHHGVKRGNGWAMLRQAECLGLGIVVEYSSERGRECATLHATHVI
jgi:hypothetical protein